MTNCRGLAARGHRLDLVYVSRGDFAEEWQGFTGAWSRWGARSPAAVMPLPPRCGYAASHAPGRDCEPDALYVYRYWDIPYAVVLGTARGLAGRASTCACPRPRWCPAG